MDWIVSEFKKSTGIELEGPAGNEQDRRSRREGQNRTIHNCPPRLIYHFITMIDGQ